MVNALELLTKTRAADQDYMLRGRQDQREQGTYDLKNQLLKFQFAQQQQKAQREAQQRNMLAQMAGGNPLFAIDPKLAIQQQTGQMRAQAMRDVAGQRTASAERIARARMAQQEAEAKRRLDPALVGQRELAKDRAKMSVGLPDLEAKANEALQQIDAMIGSEDGSVKPHAGFEDYVGATWLPGMRFVEGSDASNFENRLNQVKGSAFLQAFETLKGGGQITEIEGQKATQAITRMNKSQSEKEFKAAAREFQSVIRSAVNRARQRAGGGQAPAGLPDASAIDAELRRRQGR